jgi:hypothetical protein
LKGLHATKRSRFRRGLPRLDHAGCPARGHGPAVGDFRLFRHARWLLLIAPERVGARRIETCCCSNSLRLVEHVPLAIPG